MNFRVASLLLLLSKSAIFATAQTVSVCETVEPYNYDSGETTTASFVVSYDGAPWLQLDLSSTQLAQGASLIIHGVNSSQELDARALAMNSFSAVFDGSSVSVEISSPGGLRRGSGPTSRVIVSAIKVGMCKRPLISDSLCGFDDRIPSTDVRAGRLSMGCTGWLISEDVYVTAGHCGTPTSSTRIHFTYGTPSAPVEDQYAIELNSYLGVNGVVGNDWGVGRLLPNSSTGKLAGVRQSEKCGSPECGWFTLGNVPQQTSVDSQSQKTHVDALTTIASNYLRYIPDTTGGNSGSPVIHEETGHAIGVHTYGGCESGGNHGTRIDKADFRAHIDYLLSDCVTDADCDDGIFCNCAEKCTSGKCTPPITSEPCNDGDWTTIDTCNEVTDQCDYSPCDGVQLEVILTTDNYPSETYWSLRNKCTGLVEQNVSDGFYQNSNTQYSNSYCVPQAEYDFVINDTFGDGICCSYGSGSYTVKYDNTVVVSGGKFASTETKRFGSCTGPSSPTQSPTKQPTSSPTATQSSSPTPAQTVPTAAPSSSPTVACSNYNRNKNGCKAAPNCTYINSNKQCVYK